MQVLSKFKRFGTKNKWNIQIEFIALTLGNFILKLKCALLLFIRLGIEIAVKSRRTVRKL